MTKTYQPLFSDAYLRSIFADEYEQFQESGAEKLLIGLLDNWNSKSFQKETTAEGAFVDLFFKQTWNYVADGEQSSSEGYSCYPQYPVEGAGQGGGTGAADLAMGWFECDDIPSTPQILCEFKDIRSNLDARESLNKFTGFLL